MKHADRFAFVVHSIDLVVAVYPKGSPAFVVVVVPYNIILAFI
jgi:hypothetical protein